MAFLLGSEYCIQSLSNDVIDLQSCIRDIITKVGKINCISWKFPDKSACEINIDDLLHTYKYDSNDIEANQVAHIILLELIIDRICLFLQLNCEYMDRMTTDRSNSSSSDKSHATKIVSPCLGLTSKKHWNKLCHLSLFLDKLNKEVLNQKRISKDLTEEINSRKALKEKAAENSLVTNKSDLFNQAANWLEDLETNNKIHLQNLKPTVGVISKDFGCKSSQTLETAFKPCESCHISQSSLKECSSILMRLLQEESESSTLLKQQHEISSIDWMNDKTLLLMKNGFIKDFEKICKIYKTAREKEISTSRELVRNRKEFDELREVVEKQGMHLETELRRIDTKKHELLKEIDYFRNRLKEAKRETNDMTSYSKEMCQKLQKTIRNLNGQMVGEQQKLDQLENMKKMIHELDGKSTDPIKALQSIRQKHQSNEQEIVDLKLLMKNEKSLCETLKDSESVFREKEEKLLKRLQNLTDQKRRMEEQIDNLQDELKSSQDKFLSVKNTNDSLVLKLSDQEALTNMLTQSKNDFSEKILEFERQIKSMSKQMMEIEKDKQLLLNYPDLNGPLDKLDTGNIEDDMQNQIKTNAMRICLLSKQNQDLENALKKLLSNRNTKAKYDESSTEFTSYSDSKTAECITVKIPNLDIGRPPTTVPSRMNSANRKVSGRSKATAVEDSRDSSRPQSSVIQWSMSPQKSSNSNHPCVCETCGRQYSQKSDLLIHKDYCAGRRHKK